MLLDPASLCHYYFKNLLHVFFSVWHRATFFFMRLFPSSLYCVFTVPILCTFFLLSQSFQLSSAELGTQQLFSIAAVTTLQAKSTIFKHLVSKLSRHSIYFKKQIGRGKHYLIVRTVVTSAQLCSSVFLSLVHYIPDCALYIYISLYRPKYGSFLSLYLSPPPLSPPLSPLQFSTHSLLMFPDKLVILVKEMLPESPEEICTSP